MPAIERQPDNINFLGPNKYKLVIKRLPNVIYFCTEVNIPSITLPQANQPNQFVARPIPGDHLQFGELQVQFIVDENVRNYEEIYDWMIALGFPHEFDQYKQLTSTGKMYEASLSGESVVSDLSVLINSSQHNVNREFVFEDAWPSTLTDLRFATTDGDVEYLIASVSFLYTKFRLKAK